MELRDALSHIDEIRLRMARGDTFRGYRALTCACSALLAMIAAAAQPYIVGSPREQLARYLLLWSAVAAISLILAVIELWRRMQTEAAPLTRQSTRIAIEQLVPCLAVGALLTLFIERRAPEIAWMLPGLWSLFFALGIFSSHQLLPRQSYLVGIYYVACGIGCLTWGEGENALSPWLMAISFGGGQILAAATLYLTLERSVEP